MLFAYFRRRKLTKIFELSSATIVRMQFVMAQHTPSHHIDDQWILGYVYGACTAVLERMGIDPSPEAYELLKSGYASIFGETRLGEKVLSNSMKLRSNILFVEAQDIGGNEIRSASPSSPIPFSLGAYLGENKSEEIKEQLRRRWSKAHT